MIVIVNGNLKFFQSTASTEFLVNLYWNVVIFINVCLKLLNEKYAKYENVL